MKTAMTIVLAAILALTSACATMRRHPALTGVVAGTVAGVSIALATHHSCPHMVNGYPYDGTAPCPGPNYEPDGKRGAQR